MSRMFSCLARVCQARQASATRDERAAVAGDLFGIDRRTAV
ncbi:MAG TPA: hypothetical protein VMZ28_06070 [Kofleriaceae bacterium]|nr:hypothetical protein [Kofleriaceae bacterium]